MRSSIAAFTVGIVLMGAGTASADPVNAGDIMKLQLSSVPRFGVGGPFLADLTGTANDFLTFCLEYNEYFTPGENLLIKTISDEAREGGVAGRQVTGDPINGTTAYIYTQFREGNSDFSNGKVVQEAIWLLENEITGAGIQATALITKAQEQMLAIGWGLDYLGGVQVLNLWRGPNYGTRSQDMLTYTSVPEPTVALLFGLATLGAAAARRRVQTP